MLESVFWKKLDKAAGKRWNSHRIENKINNNTPDVFVSIPSYNNIMISCMLELKCQEISAKGTINAKHYTQGQRDFALIHRNVWLLLQSSNAYYLFDYTVANIILRGQSLDWHKSIAIVFNQSIDNFITDCINVIINQKSY